MPMPSKTKASLRQAELAATGAQLALSRSAHFCSELAAQSQGNRNDAEFLTLLLSAALQPSLRPSIAADECLSGFANAQPSAPYPGPIPHDNVERWTLSVLQAAPELRFPTALTTGQKRSEGPIERLTRDSWAEPFGRALKIARPDLAAALAPFAMVMGAQHERVSALARVCGWDPQSEWSESALRMALRARSLPMTRIALAHGALIRFQPNPIEPWGSALEELSRPLTDSESAMARKRMGLNHETDPAAFLPQALEALFSSPAWVAMPANRSASIAQRLLDDQFVAHPTPLAKPLSARLKSLFKTAGAVSPSPWAYRRAVVKQMTEVFVTGSGWGSGGVAAHVEKSKSCAALIAEAASMPELLRAPPAGCESIEPFCLVLTEGVGDIQHKNAEVERAYTSAMDQWAASSFGEHALQWTQARSGSTHSAPNALCSLPKTKHNDWSEPIARWVGAFLAQGFDADFKASPKSKSLSERARGSKALAPIYALSEASALSSAMPSAPSQSKPASSRL